MNAVMHLVLIGSVLKEPCSSKQYHMFLESISDSLRSTHILYLYVYYREVIP